MRIIIIIIIWMYYTMLLLLLFGCTLNICTIATYAHYPPGSRGLVPDKNLSWFKIS